MGFLSGWNIIFISLHSEWQFFKIAAHQGIFITFCRPAWVARQLFITLHLSSISLSQKAHFSCQFPALYFAMTFRRKLLGLCYSQFWDLPGIIFLCWISHTLRCPITRADKPQKIRSLYSLPWHSLGFSFLPCLHSPLHGPFWLTTWHVLWWFLTVYWGNLVWRVPNQICEGTKDSTDTKWKSVVLLFTVKWGTWVWVYLLHTDGLYQKMS